MGQPVSIVARRSTATSFYTDFRKILQLIKFIYNEDAEVLVFQRKYMVHVRGVSN